MPQIDMITGFSDLKDLLIRTYNIQKPREFIRLYFTLDNDYLLMHDFHDHKKVITLCFSINSKILRKGLTIKSQKLVMNSLNQNIPSEFLNNEFQLNGFFRF